MAGNKDLYSLPEVGVAVAALSPENRELLDAVQASPFRLTEPEQFQEFAANIDYFVFEPNVQNLNDLGWRYIAQHMDMQLPPELLDAIDPIPFGQYAMKEYRGTLPNTDIFPFPATSGSMTALWRKSTGSRRKRRPSGTGWNRAKRNVPAGRRRPQTRGSLSRSFEEVTIYAAF